MPLLKNSEARFNLYLTLLIGAVALSYVYKTTGGTFRYHPLSREVAGKQIYQYGMLAEAFRHGQLSLLVPASPQLQALPNPYDPHSRGNVSYPWDTSYYNGKLFLYFSPVPVLLFHLPWTFLFGNYPDQGLVLDFMLLVYFLALGAAMYFLCGENIRRHPVLALSVFLLFGIANGGRPTLDNPTWYTLATGSAAMWTSLHIMFVFHLVTRGANGLNVFGAALAFVLAVWSRPLVAAVTPLAWLVVLGPYRLPLAMKYMGSYIAVIALGTGVIGTYNYLRFDSPFDFGHRFSLTVKDNTKYWATWTLSDVWQRELATLPYVLFHFPKIELNPPKAVLTKPKFVPLPPTGNFLYGDVTIGMFALCPFLLLFLIGLHPPLFVKLRKSRNGLFAYALMLGAGTVVFYLGNISAVASRYALDAFPMLLLATSIFLFESVSHLSPIACRRVVSISVLLCLCSVGINLLI